MEIQFEQKHHQNQKPASKLKGRNRRTNNNKFVGVRQRPSGRWVAEIKDTTQNIRMWLGTFETAEEAARAYDEAACLLRGSNTRTNFIPHRVSAPDSPLASRIRNLLKIKKEAKQQGSSESSDSSTSNHKKIGSNSISFTSCSDVSNNNNNNGGEECLPTIQDDTQLFDDAYKPDLSNCNDEFELGSSQSGLPWGGGGGPGFDDRFPFNQEFFDVSRSVERSDDDELELSELDRMKVERQISASLYAMSGVQECMESVDQPAETFWDLPPLCSLLCWN